MMKNKFKILILTIALSIGFISAFGFAKPLYALNNIYMNEINDYSTWKHMEMKTRHESDNYFYHTLTRADMEINNNKRNFIGDFEDYANDLIGQNYVVGYHQFELFTADFIIKFTVENVEYIVVDMFLEIETDDDGGVYNYASINSLYVVFRTNNYPIRYYYFDNGFYQLDTNGIEVQLINYGEINDNAYQEGYEEGYEEGRADYGEYFPPGSPDGFEGWYGFQSGYDYGYEYGYDYGYFEGLNADYQEAYDKGYDKGYEKGQQEDFSANLGTWIVPAIILVLIGGGFISFAKYRGSKNE